jgi:hypothetical protein
MMKWFRLDRETAVKWVRAFGVLYDEAGAQIERLRADYPEAAFLNLAHDLTPPEKYFWDLAHVYDEANMIVAERIFTGRSGRRSSRRWGRPAASGRSCASNPVA